MPWAWRISPFSLSYLLAQPFLVRAGGGAQILPFQLAQSPDLLRVLAQGALHFHAGVGIRSAPAVAADHLEVQVGQRLRRWSFVVDCQGKPHPQHSDIHREAIAVHAVEVALDDLQLQVVEAFSVHAHVEESGLQLNELLHHA